MTSGTIRFFIYSSLIHVVTSLTSLVPYQDISLISLLGTFYYATGTCVTSLLGTLIRQV